MRSLSISITLQTKLICAECYYAEFVKVNNKSTRVVCLNAGFRPLSARLEQFDQILYHGPLFTYFLYFLTSIFTQNQIKTPQNLSKKAINSSLAESCLEPAFKHTT